MLKILMKKLETYYLRIWIKGPVSKDGGPFSR